ncbi:MAG: ATP-binding protein [Myxococcaceae bacterium]
MRSPLRKHVVRRLERLIPGWLRDEPAIALQGPRSVGKSTLLRQVASAARQPVIDLDDPATRDAVRSDPSLFARAHAPVCIDEFQHVPEILDAIKAELNKRLEPGRFVLTGSTRYAGIPRAAQSLTGRLHTVTVWPLSQGELAGVDEDFMAVLLEEPERLLASQGPAASREEYVERALAGGFPLALQRATSNVRARWFDDYVRLVIERDVLELSRIRQREWLPRLLLRLASQTGQLLNIATAAQAIGLERSTAENYTQLLEAVFLLHRIPAWGRTLRARAVASPKVYLIDSGLAARLLGLSEVKLARLEPAAIAQFGHLLETFTIDEALKQLSWLEEAPSAVGHWRTHDGDEVDLVVERADGTLVGLEVKAAGRVVPEDTRGLCKLRDALGKSFLAGVVLYTGEHAYSMGDRIYAAPVDHLWRRHPR